MFIISELSIWLFQPEYNQKFGVSYLGREETDPYLIPLRNFLPNFAVTTINIDQEIFDVNNSTNWYWFWTIDGKERHDVESVSCKSLINTWTDLKDEERSSLIDELYGPFMLCPNLTEFYVEGG